MQYQQCSEGQALPQQPETVQQQIMSLHRADPAHNGQASMIPGNAEFFRIVDAGRKLRPVDGVVDDVLFVSGNLDGLQYAFQDHLSREYVGIHPISINFLIEPSPAYRASGSPSTDQSEGFQGPFQ